MTMHVVWRATAPADAAAFLKAVRDNASFLTPWVTTPWRVFTLSEALDAVTLTQPSGQPARFGAFVGARLVGSAKVMPVNGSEEAKEIGVWSVADLTGLGIGTWLIANVIELEFAGATSKIILRRAAANTRSRVMIARLGGTPTIRLWGEETKGCSQVYEIGQAAWASGDSRKVCSECLDFS
jgi:RimJ/RimL family protein N-acetyltransferase